MLCFYSQCKEHGTKQLSTSMLQSCAQCFATSFYRRCKQSTLKNICSLCRLSQHMHLGIKTSMFAPGLTRQQCLHTLPQLSRHSAVSLPHAVAAIHKPLSWSRIAPVMLILQAGTYIVTYSAADKAGNVGTASRSVVVSSPCVSPNFFCPATCRSAFAVVLLQLPGSQAPMWRMAGGL